MAYSKKQKAKILDTFERMGGNISATCNAHQISRKTFHEWCNKEEWFKDKAEEIKEGMIDNVESVLYRQAMEGNTTSLIFLLKTQAKERGYTERQEIGISHIEQPLFPEVKHED